MSDIVYVSPQKYLLSKARWKSDSQKPGYVPILRADVARFQQSLQGLAQSSGTQQRVIDNSTTSETKTSTMTSASLTTGKGESNGSLGAYQNLKQFFPIGLQQQLHTISLRGIPNKLSDEKLERFLRHCIKVIIDWQSVEGTVEVESWTNVRFTELQKQDLYFRLGETKDSLYAVICRSLEVLFPSSATEPDKHTIELHIDSNTKRFIQDCNVELLQKGQQEAKDEVTKLLKALESSDGGNDQSAENTLDLSTDYQIDLNTLSDLPSESLPQLCKDIIEFRTRVVSIEREKRIRDAYEESKRRKHQMMRIFDDIRRSGKETTGPEDIESDESDDEQAGSGTNLEDDLLAERQRQDRIGEELNLRYEEAIRKLRNDTEPRLIALQKEITRQRNYEQTLIDERPLHLKQLLHQANDPYYDHHRSFKQSEEDKDAADRDKHGSEEPLEPSLPAAGATATADKPEETPQEASAPVPEQVKIKFAFKKAIDKSIGAVDDESPAQESQTDINSQEFTPQQSLPDILPFQDDQLESYLEKLKQSRVVDELVKEYLGVYEDELVQYILDNIREHRSKQILLDELKETFDDEAVTIVDAIWSNHNHE